MKVSKLESLQILKAFEVDLGDVTINQVDHFEVAHPQKTNTLVSLRIFGRVYHILFDDYSNESEETLASQIKRRHPENQLQLIVNPQQTEHWGLPFKGKTVYLLIETRATMRLDVAAHAENQQLTRSSIQKHIKAGHVLVDGEVVTKPSTEVAPDSQITFEITDSQSNEQINFPIIYIDDDVIVIDKPTGVLTHAKGGIVDEFTVASFFRQYTTDGLDGNRPGIVHRLDRATSGLIIGARTPEAKQFLQKQFSNRTVKKVYRAIVADPVNPSEALIDVPIGRNPKYPSTFMANPSGKSAQTYYQIIEEHGNFSQLELRPQTGRTHQLRVHLNYIGAPIVGDTVYGGRSAERLYLHAYQLEVTLPGGKRQMFTAGLPDDFRIERFS